MHAAASSLDLLSPAARSWFEASFRGATDVQVRGWASVAAGNHTLMCAPTGSGKTLAAFFWCIDRLGQEERPGTEARCRVLYLSPLKALTLDIERNLRPPLRGVAMAAERLGLPEQPDLTVGVRTGDTPARERREMVRRPPDILVTTPESLFLLLTSAARRILTPIRYVIVDEIHVMAATKRGAHLALSLERLSALTATPPQRIGLSATQRPLDEVGRFLVGAGREVTIVDAGRLKTLDISVEVPVDDMGALDAGHVPTTTGPAAAIGEAGRARPRRRTIWPAIHPRILELIREHASTIVFVNSRRLAERLAGQLNELAGEDLVRAHHGSIARERRMRIEDDLKAGRLPALVATSSLELGIDMGTVDLVIQVESPTTVARGIQRIGRAGHSVGAPSRGVIFPKHRGDLLECAAVVERILEGTVEITVVPRNPIDVLAQQIVAMAAMDTWDADEMRALVTRAYPFADLGRRAFEGVLDMLDGRFADDAFGDLRARIVHDRATGTVRGRHGAQRLAVTSGGTIPDRGLYTVNIVGDGRRVGELDEEMVYELRAGETFVLGASTWRVAEITPVQVMVVPAPGEPGKVAFWHGDAAGRPVELGLAVGAMVRELRNSGDRRAIARLRDRSRLDERAARNLLGYIADQVEHSGAVPDDRTVVVERFRDQIGDWRVCVLSPWGARVHTPWSLVAEARLRDRLGVGVQSIASDDGFVLRLPGTETRPDVRDLLIEPDAAERLVTDQLHSSSLFAARFRENAARALLLPRRRPGRRTPLWQQRQRSHNLLQVASRHPDFPIIIETYRECLATVFDMPALIDLMTRIRSGLVRVVDVETESSSPFAASLLFGYVAEYMYEGDAPLAERRAQALTLDRDLLAELLGRDELRDLIDTASVEALEVSLQGLDPARHPRDPDGAVDVLRRLGDLDRSEAAARGIPRAWLDRLVGQGRVLSISVGGGERWIAADDAGRYRDALGAVLPEGISGAFLGRVDNALGSLVSRYARTHAPFVTGMPAERWGVTMGSMEGVLSALAGAGTLLTGQFRPGRVEREYCDPDVLGALRRRTLAGLRHEVEPVPVEVLARFAPAWQGVGSVARGTDRLVEILGQLEGVAIPVSTLERDVLGSRMHGYTEAMLDALLAAGEVVWTGRGSLGPVDGRIAFYLRDSARTLVAQPLSRPDGELHQRIRGHLESRGASFFRDLTAGSSPAEEQELLSALYDMVWAGEVTNDGIGPLRAQGIGSRVTMRRSWRRPGPPRAGGRWSLVAQLVEPPASAEERVVALCLVLLRRHGVVTRESVLGEGIPGGFTAVYTALRQMEEAGKVRRGYFVDGLGAAQFALPGAVDRLRSHRDPDGAVIALAATDPACQFGITAPWPAVDGRVARVAGAYVVTDSGELRLFVERGGRSLVTVGSVGEAHVAALHTIAARRGSLEVVSVDGQPVERAPIAHLLRRGGFVPSPRGLVLYPPRAAMLRR